MKTTWIAAAALLALPIGAFAKEQHLTLDQVPAPVRATIEKESAGGKVGEIEKEGARGRTFYEAEIVKDGKESYLHVAPNGKVLKRETAEEERKAEGRNENRR